MKKWSIHTLFLAILCCSIFSCTKEKQELLSEEQNALYSIDVTVKNDMLSFPNNEEYLRAVKVIASTPDEAVISWIKGLGFPSLWTEFYNIEARIPDEDNTLSFEEILSSDEKKRYQIEDNTLNPNLSIRPIGYLVNSRFRVSIGNSLHYFDDRVHIVIADGQEDKLTRALAGKEPESSIVRITYQQNSTETQNALAKLEQKLVNCAASQVTNVAHKKKVGSDQIIVELRTYQNAFASSDPSTDWELTAETFINIRNLRKSGFIWKHTAKTTNIRSTAGSSRWIVPNILDINLPHDIVNEVRTVQWWDEILVVSTDFVRVSVIGSNPHIGDIAFLEEGTGRGSRFDVSSLDIEVGCQ
ncbi:MAG: hypothetical protein R2828_25820 [Saprospiraceae bacterium]